MSKFAEYYSNNKDDLNVFCEVGVHFFEYCSFKEQIEDDKRVILVEPSPRCCVDIKNNILSKPNVALHEVAITDKIGMTELFDEGPSAFISETRGKSPCHILNYYDTFNSRKAVASEICTVSTTTFDTIDEGNIDVLFIDTEGSEYFVLQNLKSKPIIISVEMYYKEYKNPKELEILDWMKRNNYIAWDYCNADVVFIKQY